MLNQNRPGAEDCRVSNVDCAGLADRTTREAQELYHCASASTTAFIIPHDAKRIEAWLEAVRGYIDAVRTGPMDMPRSNGQLYACLMVFPMGEDGSGCYEEVQNDLLKDILRRLLYLWTETTNCQSVNIGNGFVPQDAERFHAMLNSIESLLQLNTTSQDYPESPTFVINTAKK